MAKNAGDDVSKKPNPFVPLISLEAEERRKLILESLRASYAPMPEVFRAVSANEERYISQFTSGRWRERIYPNSDDSDAAEDEESESPVESSKNDEPRKLLIYGHDLKCEEYLREGEMIMKWNIVEREQHFPNLEKDYMEKRKARSQPKERDQAGASETSQSQDIAMKEPSGNPAQASEKSSGEVCQELPDKRKVAAPPGSEESSQSSLEDIVMEEPSKIPAESSKEQSRSSGEVQESPSKIVVDTPPGSVDPFKTPTEASRESPRSEKVVCQESPSKRAQGSESAISGISKTSGDLVEETDKKCTKPVGIEDSKEAKGSSESDMETSGAMLSGKRKAECETSEGDDPDEKRTRKTSAKE